MCIQNVISFTIKNSGIYRYFIFTKFATCKLSLMGDITHGVLDILILVLVCILG